MTVRVRCNCGYRMELPDEWAGKQGRCPQCGQVLQIPELPKPAHREPAAPSRAATERAKPSPMAKPAMAAESEPAGAPGLEAAWQSSIRGSHRASSERSAPEVVRVLFGLLRSPGWLCVVVASVLLMATGAFLLVREPASHAKAKSDAANTDEHGRPLATPGAGAEVFRPAVETPDTSLEPSRSATAGAAVDPKVGSAGPQPLTDLTPVSPPRGSFAPDSCRLADFGVDVPTGVGVIEVDGVVLPVKDPGALVAGRRVVLVLPLGRHTVRFARGGSPRVVEPRRWLLEAYREAAEQVKVGGRWSFDRLLELSRPSLDRFTEPLVPHFWGNYYWQEGQREAAERNFAWALEIAPTFAPSYLNLAQLAHERGDDAAARRYLRLADLWNVQNAYGISWASSALHLSLGEGDESGADDAPDWLVSRHGELTARDRDMTAVLTSAAEFAPRRTERAKILNNLGAYFEHTGKPELAVEQYRSAAASLGGGSLDAEQRRIIAAILDSLARVCRKANMPESQRYERMRAAVQ